MFDKSMPRGITRHSLLVVLLLCMSGCAQLMVSPAREVETHCGQLFNALDEAVAQQDVRDVQDRRVAVAPYLRVNRLLASFRDEVQGEGFEQWLDAMQALGISGWSIEYANLGVDSRQSLWSLAQDTEPPPSSFEQALRVCADEMRGTDFSSAAAIDALRQAAVVEDNYSILNRALGLYPLTALAFRKGISDWHEETHATYMLTVNQLPVQGELLSYTAADDKRLEATEIAAILRRSSDNPLGIPMPGDAELDDLFASYAPMYEIDTATGDDRIGRPVWAEHGEIQIDTSEPVVYRYTSHTRFRQQTLLQLNYVIWFAARTSTSSFDLLAGDLDGITWRVTLLPNGRPLVYDSIHNCGCYHLFFAGEGAKQTPVESGLAEPAFFPIDRQLAYEQAPLVLHIASGTHYINNVYELSSAPLLTIPYSMQHADKLRSLPQYGQQHRSLYDEEGLVPGSERLERFLFWPMGIPSAGAMRQAGHHATAFVGRRHFDDAHLFEPFLQLEMP